MTKNPIDSFQAKAKAAYAKQDYRSKRRIEGLEIVDLKRFNDDGGSMCELGRLNEGLHAQLPGFVVRQVNYSVLEPLAIKAFHLHTRQTDVWFVPPTDKILLVLGDVRAGSPTEGQVMRFPLGDGNSRLVRIPPGVAHGCKNLGVAPARIVYMTDERFDADPARTDEGRLPWDMVGAEIWEPAKD